MLDDKNINVRLQAIESLGHIKNPSAIPHLQKIYENATNLKIHRAAAKALIEISNPQRTDIIIKIATHPDKLIPPRFQAILALGDIGTDEAKETLIEIAKTDKTDLYRTKAIKALGKCHAKGALPVLSNLLKAQEKTREKWRKIRDEQAPEDDKKYKKWQNRLNQYKPKIFLEYELGYAITLIDPENEGINLL
ncbi:MAG: HEAT repeat domain-containing protein [Desulfobacteraceae bacterium]|nr:HEAT repeat domain-containing protein [Desulfobacteraceae bacterium]